MTHTVFTEGYKNYALSIDKVHALDAWLEEKYGIRCLESPCDPEIYTQEIATKEKKKVASLRRRIGKQKATISNANIELANIFAKSPWREIWHSKRRAWLLDSLTMACAVAEVIKDQSSLASHLDVGCHVGFLSTYLFKEYGIQSTGIDIAGDAIAEAVKLSECPKIEFLTSTPGELAGKRLWQYVTAVDLVQPNEADFSSTMKDTCDLVAPGGHLLVIGNFYDGNKVLSFYREMGFSCIRGQLTGGFHHGLEHDEFPDWSTKYAYHFVKTKGVDIVTKAVLPDMYEFAEYANSGESPPKEINRSYFLGRKLNNPRKASSPCPTVRRLRNSAIFEY